MDKAWKLPSVLMCGTILIGINAAQAQENYRQTPEQAQYQYGQLMVQRSHSTWNQASATPATQTYSPAPRILPGAANLPSATPTTTYKPLPTLAAPVAPQLQTQPMPAPVAMQAPAPVPGGVALKPQTYSALSYAPADAPAPTASAASTPSASHAMMGAYYMPSQPVNNSEPVLAPGEALPAQKPAYSPAAMAAPALEATPLESSAMPQNAAPAAAAYAPPPEMMMAEPPRYVSGPEMGELHQGQVIHTKDGVEFKGPIAASNKGYRPAALYLNFANGYRTDDLDWNIDSSLRGITTPNILSELEWKDLSIYEIKGGAAYTHRDGYAEGAHVEVSGAYGWIMSGDNQDSDFLENDRSSEFSRSNNDAGDGNVSSFEIAAGWEFNPDVLGRNAHFGVMPLVGYQRETQDLVMQDGNQTVTSPEVGVPLGPFNGLDNRYETVWDGPFFGLNVAMEWPEHRVNLRGKYISADYEAKGYWNLRSEFSQDPSFLHSADGDGYDFSANYNWNFYDGLELFLEAAFRRFTAEDGIDATFFVNGQESVTGLNEVTWSSQSYRMGLAYRW